MISFIKKLYPYIKLYKSKVILAIFFGVLMGLIKGWQASLVKPIIDQGLSPESSFTTAAIPAVVILLSATISFPIRFYHYYWIRMIVYESTCIIRNRLFSKVQKLPMKYYAASKQGEVLSIMSNDSGLFSEGLRGLIDLVREPFTVVCLVGVALYQDWQLTLVFFAVAPLFTYILKKSGEMVKDNQKNVQKEIGAMTHNISEGIIGQKIAKAFNLQSFVLGRFKTSQDRYLGAQNNTTVVEEIAHPLVEWVGAFAFAFIIIFAYYRVKCGDLTPGGFTSFMAAMALIMDPIRRFSTGNIKLNQARAAGERIFELLEQEPEKDEGTYTPVNFNSEIVVKDLTFSYDGVHPVIKNLNVSVKKGEKVALVGLSGSGKSTLINLLLGLYPVNRNLITIDGVDINDIKLSSLRGLFGLVSQDIFLFNDSIKNNLLCGNEFTDEELRRALDISYASEFVDKLPYGMDTMIGDRGSRLSGGQQQRLTIARAFLRNNDVFLFDEATSALDNESEKVVQHALDDLAKNKTVIAIAHRLSSIQDYDRIYVLKEGEVVEVGTHDELMNRQGEYKKLYELSLKR